MEKNKNEFGYIGFYVDDSDGVFDNSEVIWSNNIEDLPNEYETGIYALTAEGAEVFNDWHDSVSIGYDLCFGKLKGIANEIGGTHASLWEYLSSDEALAKRIL